MKKIVLFVLFAVACTAGMAFALGGSPDVQNPGAAGPNTFQLHSYDGLVCTDCHTLHSTDGNGAAVAFGGWNTGYGTNGAGAATSGFPSLLKKGNTTDMCLSCHKEGNETSSTADLGIAGTPGDTGWTAPIVMTLTGNVPAGKSMPAGDFYWSNLDPKKGHNPACQKGENCDGPNKSKTLAVDPILKDVPPGNSGTGVYATATDDDVEGWTCHSCHGMHSRFSAHYTSWRQLHRKIQGVCQTGDVSGYGVETFSAVPKNGAECTQDPNYEPIKSNSRGDLQADANGNKTKYMNVRKDGNALEGADLFADYGNTNHNVYRGGFSSFCSVCHGNFHGGSKQAGVDQDYVLVANQTSNVRTVTAGGADVYLKHPTNIMLGDPSFDDAWTHANGYGIGNQGGTKTDLEGYKFNGYSSNVVNQQNINSNPVGYDWRYPLVKPDTDFSTTRTTAGAMNNNDRIMCLTCHQAHASPYNNMTRWDAQGLPYIADGGTDKLLFLGTAAAPANTGDNPIYGCAKCHQKGGRTAFKKSF